MNKLPKILSLLFLIAPLLCALFSTSVLASSITLSDSVGEYPIGLFIDIYEDVEGNLTIDDISSKQYENQFIPSTSSRPGFGFTKSVYWVRFKVIDESLNSKWFLQVSYPPLDYLDLYSANGNGGFGVQQMGDLRPFSDREIENNQSLFSLAVDNKERAFFLRIKSESSLSIPLSILSGKKLTETVGVNNYFQGIYFGIMFVMAIYNLFVYFSVRDRSYIYYVIFIVNIGLFQLAVSGYSSQFLWSDWTWWCNTSTLFSVSIAIAFSFLFTQSFLNSKKHSPKIHSVLTVLFVISLTNSVLSLFLPYRITAIIVIVIALPGVPLAFLAGVLAMIQKSRPARYYLAAWSIFICATFVFLLRVSGLIPGWLIIEYMMQIGSVIEVVLLALGLADRINVLKSEALAASESSNQIKDEFMSTITHELLTPMNGIKLSLSLLDPEVKSQDGQQALKTANDSSTHLLNLVESMFTFVQARRGSIKLKNEPFNFKATLKNVFEQFNTIKFNDDLSLSLDLSTNFPDWIVGDEDKFSLVVVQLMKNACSYTHKGEVTLRCERVTDDEAIDVLRVIVKDTGSGIGDDKLAEIFDAFNQADNSINRVHGGMGIGLTIVKDLLSLMGATLKVDSALGRGTTFLFEMPVILASQEQIDEGTKVQVAYTKGDGFDQSKILVVEDNPVNMKLMCKILERSNYIPLSAIHGKEALTILKENPDILAILMDCQMPVMDGFEATREIRKIEEYTDLPIIAVTANVSEEDQQRCHDVGMSDYLQKPVKRKLLESTLIKWLEKSKLLA